MEFEDDARLSERLVESLSCPTLSIVVPCYNEEAVLPETVGRLLDFLGRMIDARKVTTLSQVILVDDGSDDRTWELIKEYHHRSHLIGGIKLSANRGHQTALIAGLFAADGDAIVSMDADLQDDITAIEPMIAAYVKGCDVVYGVRRRRPADSLFKRVSAKAYYRFLALLGVKIVHNHADFRLLSRRAVDALRQYPEVNLFLRGMIPLIGYRSTTVFYDRADRFAGKSKYTLRKMSVLAFDGITSFTAFPLRVISFLGIFFSFLSAGMMLWVLWVKLFTPAAVPGWASSVIAIYFLGGIQLLSIGVVGEYVSKLYFEAKRRPRYFVEETLLEGRRASQSLHLECARDAAAAPGARL
jgi:glycosyltransferase involved in cell wall biosynthesis